MTSDIVVVTDPAPDVLVSAIHRGLLEYNAAFVELSPKRRFAVLVRDENGTPLGGLEAELRFGWLHVVNFWLPESLRRGGTGRAVLQAAEAHAIAQGCTAAYLDTFEFQARGFYEKQGYTVFGVQEGYPPGFQRYYLEKRLVGQPSAEES